MMLQPTSPSRSGEFSTHGDAGCALTVFAITNASRINALPTHEEDAFIAVPP
jgi:hypothetical protein